MPKKNPTYKQLSLLIPTAMYEVIEREARKYNPGASIHNYILTAGGVHLYECRDLEKGRKK